MIPQSVAKTRQMKTRTLTVQKGEEKWKNGKANGVKSMKKIILHES